MRGVVNVGCRWNGSPWNSWPQAGVKRSGWGSQTIAKKTYFWWYENLACGDATGSKWIEKVHACLHPRSIWRKRREGAVWFGVCGVPLGDDWMIGSMGLGPYGYQMGDIKCHTSLESLLYWLSENLCWRVWKCH